MNFSVGKECIVEESSREKGRCEMCAKRRQVTWRIREEGCVSGVAFAFRGLAHRIVVWLTAGAEAGVGGRRW